MDPALPPTLKNVIEPSAAELSLVVRAALEVRYERPVVLTHGTHVAVLDGAPLELARQAVGSSNASRIVSIDIDALDWWAVPDAGLRLWRQHGRAELDGELVTEVEVGDPPIRVICADDGWMLIELADGARGWIREQQLARADQPAATLGATDGVDVEQLAVEVEGFAGVPYVWGGTTDAGVDCSGIVQRAAWRASGVWLPRHSRALLRAGTRVASASIERGDVLVLQRDPATVDAERAAQQHARAEHEQRTGRVPATGPAVHPMHVAVAVSTTECMHASRDALRVVREPIESIRERYRVLGVRRLGGAR